MTNAIKIDVASTLSLNENIEILSELKTVDALRELIQIYYNCEWRESKFLILDCIGKFSHQRSFQFLSKIALEHIDLPLSEKAVHSLSKISLPIARRFLNHQYKIGPNHLKPSLIKALSEIPDRSMAEEFLQDLNKSITDQQSLLSKNLALALGEFKYQPASEILFQIASNKKQRDLALSAIVSLGQILRSPERFEKLENEFKKDSFEQQIYNTSLHQIQFRSQWKLEDYLQKFYMTDKYHPAIFFEIASFPESEIKAGIELFATNENSAKTLLMISYLPAAFSLTYFTDHINKSTSHHVWPYLSQYLNSDFKKLILEFKDIKNLDWLNCISAALPQAEEIYKDIINGSDFTILQTAEKIQILNCFSDYLLSMTGDTKKIVLCGKWIELQLTIEKNDQVIGRWVRLLSDINFDGAQVIQFVTKHVANKSLSASCLYYIKNNPHHSFLETLFLNQDDILNKLNFKRQFIKALSTQTRDKSDDKKISTVLHTLIQSNVKELKLDVLKLLSKNPIPEFKKFVHESLTINDENLNLAAVLCIKKYADETATEIIAQHLHSKNTVLRGRALDTLLAQPGTRAKRLAIDYFKDHAIEVEVCDKIIRCFVAPENNSEYFFNTVSEVIQKNPNHSLVENLIEFRSQLQQQAQSENKSTFSSTTEDIQKIEKDLEKKLSYYKFYDETAKSALRSAEVPFHHPEMYDRYIDKSAIILGYTKAIDIILEKQLGRKILFPILEKRIFEFQNMVHTLGLNEDYPQAEKILKNLNLEKEFSAQSLPVHKMSLIAQGILNTKIINDHFKILDGLRAWAIVLLLFSRKTVAQPKPLVPLFSDNTMTVNIAKKLMWLQDLRNPVAHRQTIIDFKTLEDIRSEVFQILSQLGKMFEKT